MNCRTIEYIVSLADTGSMKLAAAKCNATTGTISHQISKLESYLGTKLFVSRADPVTLSDRGKDLLPLMRQVVESLRDINRLARMDA
ncbi:LysR family transcriptional regulator [Spongiibacter nanhainus]|uniref:LysR family transcriptional regulator n=1 Tax=Spongiibacter nanhainus TaxID=2794344 RepID=A0A7T4UPP3_9GAMM|nr:LysR family transcriptional regulator [Spongiibacter nanhainus]QQD17898.1 LysR family transcriptional regulator [Spongiibacter nanhainus]